MKRIATALVALVALLGSLLALQTVEAGGGGGNYACQGDKDVSQMKEQAEIVMRDNCFGPVVARVPQGATVRWTNTGQQQHNIIPMGSDGTSGLKTLQNPGGNLTMTFAQAGAFVYYCSYHPGMTGAVFVGDSLGESNPEVAPSSSASSVPPPSVPLPQIASVTLPPRDADGVSALTVVLLALAVGTVAGGGSTLLTRRLDRR